MASLHLRSPAREGGQRAGGSITLKIRPFLHRVELFAVFNRRLEEGWRRRRSRKRGREKGCTRAERRGRKRAGGGGGGGEREGREAVDCRLGAGLGNRAASGPAAAPGP